MYRYSYNDIQEGHIHELNNAQFKKFQKITDIRNDEDFLNLIKNLSDPTKYKIVMLLKSVDAISVNNISDVINENQSTVSHALKDLKNIGLITSYRCGKLHCYQLSRENKKSAKYIDKFFEMFGHFKKSRKSKI